MSHLGRIQDLGLTKETTRLTGESSAAKFLTYQNFDLQESIEHFVNDSAFGRREGVLSSNIAQKMVEGNLEVLLDADTIGDLFFYHFGSVSSNTALGATTHVFSTLQNTQLPTFSAFYERATLGWMRAVGVTINELEISLEVGADAGIAKATLMGISEATVSSQTPSYSQPANILLPRHATMKYASTVAGLSGGTAYAIKSFKVNSKNNSEYYWSLGDVNPNNTFSRKYEAEVEFTAVMSTAAFDGFARAGTNQGLLFSMVNDQSAVIGTSALKPTVNIEVAPAKPKVTYSTSKDDIVTFDCVMQTQYSISDGFMIRPTVINAVSSY